MYSKVMASLSYLGILSLVPLIMNRDDTFVRFHARQGIVLWMWEVLAVYALLLPVFGHFIFKFTALVCVVLSGIGLLSALLGRAWKFPVIGDWAEKL